LTAQQVHELVTAMSILEYGHDGIGDESDKDTWTDAGGKIITGKAHGDGNAGFRSSYSRDQQARLTDIFYSPSVASQTAAITYKIA
jgi:hypothetical protein